MRHTSPRKLHSPVRRAPVRPALRLIVRAPTASERLRRWLRRTARDQRLGEGVLVAATLALMVLLFATLQRAQLGLAPLP